MNTPIMQTLLPLVREYGSLKAKKWLEGEEELAIADDDLASFLARQDVEWDHLLTVDQDCLRDAYIEAGKAEMARRLTGSDPVASSLPVSVAPAASLSPEAAYAFLTEENAVLRSQIENHDATLEQVKACHRSQVNLLREKLKDCEKALERAESAPAASCASPAPLVPEVVQVAVEALELAESFIGEYSGKKSDRAFAKIVAALTALRSYSPVPSPSVELLKEAKASLEGIPAMLRWAADPSFKANGNTRHRWRSAAKKAESTLSKLNAALA